MSLSAVARAKINLTLEVTGKRDTGYHELRSIVVFAKEGDHISLATADKLSLSCAGPFGAGLEVGANNLVLKAARALQDFAGISSGADIHLIKNLPVASGIGGGSADAACTLLLLKDLWNVEISQEDLHAIALSLGADVPACLMSQPLLMQGIGEILTPLAGFPEKPMLLVNPGVSLSTPEIFGRLELDDRTAPVKTARELPVFEDVAAGVNDLQPPAMALLPEIKEVLDALRAQKGVHCARMSGSGATCFALFETQAECAQAASQIQAEHLTWWVLETQAEGA
jgi:4-diphosphocytidyl-2-C-methyl-D-erythritol kinase